MDPVPRTEGVTKPAFLEYKEIGEIIYVVAEKDRDGQQKRIEYRGRYLRASRTGGGTLRAQTKTAGLEMVPDRGE